MLFNIEAVDGEWFNFFDSHIDSKTGDVIYHDPEIDARVKVRSLRPFFEERLSKRKMIHEHVLNPKTRAMERIGYYPDISIEEKNAEDQDAWDYAITGIECFKNSRTGELIACTRENKIALMQNPVFDRFIARCFQLLAESGVKREEDESKNSGKP